IENNTITGLSYTAQGTSGGTSGTVQVAGILSNVASSVNIIQGNTISGLSNTSPFAGTGVNSSIIGIAASSTSGPEHWMSGNTIRSRQHEHASNAVNIHGIFYNGSTSGTNAIDGNFVHSFSMASANAAASMNGIYLGSGAVNVTNNMV